MDDEKVRAAIALYRKNMQEIESRKNEAERAFEELTRQHFAHLGAIEALETLLRDSDDKNEVAED